jgi:hypothetical protein
MEKFIQFRTKMSFKNKRGVSVIIGYVMLIAIVITISLLVYQWMKSYVPQEALQCPDGVSVVLQDYKYDCTSGNSLLNFSLVNQGTFSVAGYFIKASNDSSQEIATTDLTPYYIGQDQALSGAAGNIILFGPCDTKLCNLLSPGKSRDMLDNAFNLSKYNFPGQVKYIEITPIRFIDYKGQNRLASCSSATITEKISCT